MGIDIHGWIEVKGNETYHGVIKIDWIIQRNTYMFGCLFGEGHIIFDPVATNQSPQDTSDEVKYDTEFDHEGSEQYLTYKDVTNINWDEDSIEPDTRVYLKDAIGICHIVKDYELSDREYDELDEKKVVYKGNIIYKLEKIKRKDCMTPDWSMLFDFMRILAEEYRDDNVRLVVWFDR